MDTQTQSPEQIEYRPPRPGLQANLITGRMKGARNKLTRERREFLDMVAGEAGTEERRQFALALRTRIMNGTASPHIEVLFLQLLCGKPTERVEVSANPSSLDPEGLTAEQIAAQALMLANKLVELRDRAIDVTPETP